MPLYNPAKSSYPPIPGFSNTSNIYYGMISDYTTVPAAQTSAFTSGSIYVCPFYLPNVATVHGMAGRVATQDAAPGHVQFAIYNNNSGATPLINRPGTKIDSTANISVASTGAVTGALAADHQLQPGWYWRAWQSDSTVVRMNSMPHTNSLFASMVGSTTLGSAISGSNYLAGYSTTGVFGTWPSDLSTATFTEITTGATGPFLILQFTSAP